MYCTSGAFLARMEACIAEIERKSQGALTFVEYIPLPHFGNVILRFDIARASYTLADLDTYEALMQDIVQDAFLVDFMGSVYQAVGFGPQMYEAAFRKCYHAYQAVPITAAADQALLQRDGAFLLEKCGLSPSLRVWEIQIEGGELALFVLGEENRKIGTYAFTDGPIHVFEVEEIPCLGLMRASMQAKARRISLVRVLMEVSS